jgi:modification methylase
MAHRGKMLPAIAATAITRYTAPGDLVADPMCGIGTTLAEAAWLGRDGLGVEYEERWARLAAANIDWARRHGATGTAEVIHGDARQLRGLAAAWQGRDRGADRHLAAVRAEYPRAGQGRSLRRRREGHQVGQHLRHRPGQPGQPPPG